MHTCIRTCKHAYIHTYIHTYIQTYSDMRTYIHRHIHIHIYSTYANTYTYAYTYMYMYIYIYIGVRTYIQTHSRTRTCIITLAHIHADPRTCMCKRNMAQHSITHHNRTWHTTALRNIATRSKISQGMVQCNKKIYYINIAHAYNIAKPNSAGHWGTFHDINIMLIHPITHTDIYALGSRAPTPPPHGMPPMLPAVPHNRNEPTQTMIPASASSQERRTASEQGQGHRLPGEKSNIIFCMVTST